MVKMHLMPLGCVHEVANSINFEKWNNEQYTPVEGAPIMSPTLQLPNDFFHPTSQSHKNIHLKL